MAEDLRTLTGNQRALALAERRRKVAALIARGRTLREIAEELDLSFGQAASDARSVFKEVERSTKLSAERHRARALAKVLHLQRDAWEMLERIRQGHVEREQTGPAGGGAGSVTLRQKSAFQAEAKALEVLRKLYEDERKLLGLEGKDEAAPPPAQAGVNIERGIVIVNEAGVPAVDGWLKSIEPGPARQGVGLLPPGTTDAEAEVIRRAVNTEGNEE